MITNAKTAVPIAVIRVASAEILRMDSGPGLPFSLSASRKKLHILNLHEIFHRDLKITE